MTGNADRRGEPRLLGAARDDGPPANGDDATVDRTLLLT